MLKKLFLLNLLIVSLFISFADSFQKANEEFSKNNYEQAEKYYLDDFKENKNDLNTLFNLANVYLKTEQEGKALYTFYRAALIDPSDAHIKKEILTLEENMNLLNQNPYPLFLSLKHNWYLTLTLLLVICVSILILSLLRFKRKNENIFYRIRKPFFISLSLLLIISFVGNVLYFNDRNSGIILNKTDVLISPYQDSDTSFTISEGSKIKVDDKFKDFLYITDGKSRYGWINKQNIGWLWKE